MKNISFTFVLILIFAVFITGCTQEPRVRYIYIGDDNGQDYTNYYNRDIDYTNYYGSECSIRVRNETNRNIVCFKGTPSADTLIGGVRAGTTSGLKRDDRLFYNSGDFVLYVVTEDDYLYYQKYYYELGHNPLDMIYVYYNADSEANSNMVYTISRYLDGDAYLMLNNPTYYNIELRMDSPWGEALAFEAANTVQTKIPVSYYYYTLYPTLRRLDMRTGEILTWFPKNIIDGGLVYIQNRLHEDNRYWEIYVLDWFDPSAFEEYSRPGAAYVTIYNGNTQTGIKLYKGAYAEAAVTSTGGKTINTGKTLVFEVPMTSLDSSYISSTVTISGWMVGSYMRDINVPELEVEAGKMYYLEVSGSSAYEINAAWRSWMEGGIVSDEIDFNW